jgi:hypothetical protein
MHCLRIRLPAASIKYEKEETTMNKRMTYLALVVSLVFIIGACASAPIDPAVKGKIGDPVAASSKNSVPGEITLSQPLSMDLSMTPAPKGVIGDPVAASSKNSVPGELTLAAPIGVDLSKTPAPKGVIGDPVAASSKNMVPGELTLSYPMK